MTGATEGRRVLSATGLCFRAPPFRVYRFPQAGRRASLRTRRRWTPSSKTAGTGVEILAHDEIESKRAPPHPARIARHPLPRAGEGFFGAENPFSRLREKVAGDSRPDEGSRHDSFKNHPALAHVHDHAASGPGTHDAAWKEGFVLVDVMEA